MQSIKKRLINQSGLLVWLLSIPAIWVLLVPGYFGASDDLHIAWLFEMDRALRSGQFPPRFVPDLSYNFGYPLFQFVYPLPFYLGELFHLIGFSLVDSVKLVFGLSFGLSGYLMYRWMRGWLGGSWAVLAAMIYMYTPYRATDVYIRGAIGESLGFVWLPLVGWAVSEIASGRGSRRWMGLGGIGVGGLVLTHNIMAYMTMPLFLLLGFGLIIGSRSWGGLKWLVGMLVMGLLISLYFWLPAIIDSGLVTGSSVFTFVDHFPTLIQLIRPYWGYGASVPGPYDGMSFFMGYINLVVIVGGVGLGLLNWRKFNVGERVLLSWAYGCLLGAIFLMNFRSTWWWENLPMLKYFQFPWRFLIIDALVVPIMLISWRRLKPSWVWVGGLILVTILPVLGWFRPQDLLGRQDDYYLNRYIPLPVASNDYQLAGEEYGTLPYWVSQRPTQNYPLVLTEPELPVMVRSVTPLKTLVNISATSPAILNYQKYYWPGWQAKIDDQLVDVGPGQPFGQVQVMVPVGDHQIELWYGHRWEWRVLDLVSLLSLLGCLGLIFYGWRGGIIVKDEK